MSSSEPTLPPAGDDLPAAFPWPPADDTSTVDGFIATWRGASLEPRTFFDALPRPRGIGPAVLYYLALAIAVEGVSLFWALALPELAPNAMFGDLLGNEGSWSPLVDFLLSPLLLLFSLFVAAGITHLLLLLFGGAPGGFNVSVRVFAYAYSPMIVSVVPVIGGIVGTVWMTVVAIVGLSAAHRIGTGRAAAAVLIPLAIGLMMITFVALIASAGLFVP